MEKREKILADYFSTEVLKYGDREISMGAWMGGTRRFEGVPLSKLIELEEAKLIDMEDAQNESPTVRQFMDMLKKHPTLTAHGYIVSEGREDARTSIEGVEGVLTADEVAELSPILGKADEYNAIPDEKHGTHYKVRAWWD